LALLAGVLPTTVAATAFLVGMWNAPAEGPHPFIPDQMIAVLIGGIGAAWWLIRTDPQAGVPGSVLLAAALLPPAVVTALYLAFDHNLPGAEQVAQIVFGAVLLYACALAVSRRLLCAAPPDGPHAA
jgi:asparagine N-glycosylation enzyme membrane subunit Stt3